MLAILALGAIGFAPARLPAQDAVGTMAMPQCGKLPAALHRHGSAVLNNRLYILGGATAAGWTQSVSSASFAADGRITQWRSESPLPELRAYLANAVVPIRSGLYIAGGNTAANSRMADVGLKKSNDVLWTTADPSGMLLPWRRSTPFPGPGRSCVAACSDGTSLVILGGSTDIDIADSVLISRIEDSGVPGGWSQGPPLPVPLWFHGAAVAEGRIFVWGGLTRRDRSFVNREVYSARFAAGHFLDGWRTETAMPNAVYASACVGAGTYLLSLAGRYVNEYPTNALWFARLASDGKVAGWQRYNTDLQAWVNHAAALDPATGTVFLTGGMNRSTPAPTGKLLDTVQAFRLGK